MLFAPSGRRFKNIENNQVQPNITLLLFAGEGEGLMKERSNLAPYFFSGTIKSTIFLTFFCVIYYFGELKREPDQIQIVDNHKTEKFFRCKKSVIFFSVNANIKKSSSL